MASLLQSFKPATILGLIVLVLILFVFIRYWRTMRGDTLLSGHGTAAQAGPLPRIMPFRTPAPMQRKDAIPLLVVTVLYAITAFWHLGSFTNPQTPEDFGDGVTREITLSSEITLSALRYYPELGTGSYCFEVSADGMRWLRLMAYDEGGETCYRWADAAVESSYFGLQQEYNSLLKWQEIVPDESATVRYLRITGNPDKEVLRLGELGFYTADESGGLYLLSCTTPELAQEGSFYANGADALFDEQNVIPEQISWYNSAYFDEIYHPRTALEHIEGIYPYEISHPPLGKLIIGLGIRMFGMTPFGWRFMGTLFGVGMLPILYVFLKNLFGKTSLAFCGTVLFAVDFMHLTQTRIATIDTYAVFFILLMYYFMYRFMALPRDASLQKCALPLFLSGLFWGIGAACKWTVIYAGVGLAVLYFIGLLLRYHDRKHAPDMHKDAARVLPLLLFTALCFIVIPAVIYTFSYTPYAVAKGDTSLSGLISVMWDNQKSMLSYHSGVNSAHPYESRWYQWIVDGRPILYYLDTTSFPGKKVAFAAFSNPVICWGGLLAVVTTAVQGFRRRSATALLIVIGYLSQLVPWMFISRTTFAYHYFPSILFLVLALCYIFHTMAEQSKLRWKPMVYGMTGAAAALYALFYPVLVGIAIPTEYSTVFLKWLPSWPV